MKRWLKIASAIVAVLTLIGGGWKLALYTFEAGYRMGQRDAAEHRSLRFEQ